MKPPRLNRRGKIVLALFGALLVLDTVILTLNPSWGPGFILGVCLMVGLMVVYEYV